jgi:hypothetical protein
MHSYESPIGLELNLLDGGHLPSARIEHHHIGPIQMNLCHASSVYNLCYTDAVCERKRSRSSKNHADYLRIAL